jgi:hypothetical protein
MNETEWQGCKHPIAMLSSLGDALDARRERLFACACCRRLDPLLRDASTQEGLATLEQHIDGAGRRPARRTAARQAEKGLTAATEAVGQAMEAWREAHARREEVWNSLWVGTPPPPWQFLRVAAEACAAQAALTELQAVQEAARAVVYATEDPLDAAATSTLAVRARTFARQAMSGRDRAGRWLTRAEQESERVVSRSRAAVRASQAMHLVERNEEKVESKAPRLARRWEREERAAQCAMVRDLFGHLWSPVRIDSTWRKWRDGVLVEMARSIRDERRFTDLPLLADTLEEAGCTDGPLLQHCRDSGPHIRGCWALDLLLSKDR